MFLFKIKSIYVISLLCAIVLCGACNTVGSDGEDTFREINFTTYDDLLTTKKFNFSPGGSETGKDCIAVAWEGNTTGTGNVFGFAVRNVANTFSLIVYVNKPNNASLMGHVNKNSDEYTVVYRNNSNIVCNPGGTLVFDIARSGSEITITNLDFSNTSLPSHTGNLILQLY